MQRVRIPVEHDGQLTQFPVGLRGISSIIRIGICTLSGRTAGEQHSTSRKSGKKSLFHCISVSFQFTGMIAYKLPRQVTTFFSIHDTIATASMATTLSSTIGANTPAPSSWVIMRRLK